MEDSLKQFQDPELSLWQSAVDQVVAENRRPRRPTLGIGRGAGFAARPNLSNSMISDTAAVCEAVEKAEFLTEVSTTRRPTLGATDVAKFCAATAFKLARARLKARFTDDNRDVDRYEQELGKFSQCD